MLFVFLLIVLPKPRGNFAFTSGYADMYNRLESKVIAWHESEITRIENDDDSVRASIRLLLARGKASGN